MHKFPNTDLSDHNKLILTISKSGSFKGTLRIKVLRSCKFFNIENFESF